MHCKNNERPEQKSMHNTEVHRTDIGVRLTEYLRLTFNTSNNFFKKVLQIVLKKVVPFHAINAYTGSRGKAPLILNTGATRRW